MNRQQHRDIITGKDNSTTAQFARVSLRFASWFYGVGVGLRNRAFDKGFRKSIRLPHPVISVGNLTAGGTGKTPHVLWVVRQLQSMNLHPAVLLRGYVPCHAQKTDDQGSDETLLLQQTLGPGVPVQANPDRVQGAKQALQRDAQVNAFVLDDGFQHRQVHRDVDLLLIDAISPFGLGRLLPAGFLREQVAGVRRAHAIIITRSDLLPADKLASLEKRLQQLGVTKQVVIANSVSHWSGLLDALGQPHDLNQLRDTKIAAVCGIGNPVQFKIMLGRHFTQVVGQYELEDHQHYTPALVNQIVDHAVNHGAQALVLTEKDWVKWQPVSANMHLSLPVYRLKLEVNITRDEAALISLLRNAFQTNQSPGMNKPMI